MNYLLPLGPTAPAVAPPPKTLDTAAPSVLPETVGVVDPKVSPDAGIGDPTPNVLPEGVGVVDPKVSPDDGIGDDPDIPGVKAFAWPLGPTRTLAVPGRPTLNGFPGFVTIVCPLPNDPID